MLPAAKTSAIHQSRWMPPLGWLSSFCGLAEAFGMRHVPLCFEMDPTWLEAMNLLILSLSP